MLVCKIISKYVLSMVDFSDPTKHQTLAINFQTMCFIWSIFVSLSKWGIIIFVLTAIKSPLSVSKNGSKSTIKKHNRNKIIWIVPNISTSFVQNQIMTKVYVSSVLLWVEKAELKSRRPVLDRSQNCCKNWSFIAILLNGCQQVQIL